MSLCCADALRAAPSLRSADVERWAASVAKNDHEHERTHPNAWVYEAYHEQPWSKVHRNWREGFLRLLELGERVSEKDLLDGDRYVWLKGYSLAFILVASYDHHQEHLEKLLAWLREHGNAKAAG